MANDGPLNGFPLNGLFDESFVGIAAAPLIVDMDFGGTSIAVGNCHVIPLTKSLDFTPLQATVGMQFSVDPTPEVGFFADDGAVDTTVEVNAEDTTLAQEVDFFGPPPVVGISYTAGFRPFLDMAPIAPTMEIGYEPPVDQPMDLEVASILPAWWIFAQGTLAQPLEIRIVEATIIPRMVIEIEIFEDGQPAQVIQQDIVDQDIQTVSQTIQFEIFEIGTPVVVIQQEVVDHTLFIYTGGENECWRPVVTLGGTDISTDITGVIRVEAEEGTARIAEFQFKPPAGAIDITVWINEQVTIDYALFNPVTDLITTQVRIFSGTVDEPVYDPNTRLVTFSASDNLQQELESMTRAQVDGITPGARWSELVFDDEADNYVYSQDRASTFPASLDKNIGGSYEFTPWAAKVTPDYTFTTSNILDETLDVELASRRDIVNRIELTFGYGYDRMIERNRHLSWHFPGKFCEYLGNGAIGTNIGPFTIPNRDMIETAIESSGWCAKSISYTKLPRTQTVICPGAGLSVWVIGTERRNFLAYGFSALIQRRFVRAIQEDFGIIITNADSIALYGQNNAERAATVQGNFDTSEWEHADECNTALGTTLVPSSDPLVPSCDSYVDTDTLAEDGTDRAAVDFAIETEIAASRTEMLSNHRQNTVSFDIPLFPVIARSQTLEIDTITVDARGKVQKFTHTMDMTSGEALTAVELAVSIAGGTTEVDSPITAPAPPDTVTPMIGGCEQAVLGLDTHYGGINQGPGGGVLTGTSPPEPDPDDEDVDQFTGYIGNKEPADFDSEIYTIKMAIPTDEISEADRDELVAENETPYTVAIPDELLNLFA